MATRKCRSAGIFIRMPCRYFKEIGCKAKGDFVGSVGKRNDIPIAIEIFRIHFKQIACFVSTLEQRAISGRKA